MMVLATVNKGTFIYLQSLGRAFASTAISMVREVLFGVGFALLLPLWFGLDGVLYSMPVSDLLTFVVCLAVIISTCRALDFDPAEFARRHAEEFTRQYMRADGMLKGVGEGEEIVLYLARRVNECLSRAEYALLSYIEYAGRSPQAGETDGFNDAVARYLRAREKNGVDWL